MTKESRFSLKTKARVNGRKYEFFFEYYFRERKEDFIIKSNTREDRSYEIELIEYPQYRPKNVLPVIQFYSNEELAPGRKFLSFETSSKSYMDIVGIIQIWSLRNIIYLETGTIVEDVLNFDLYFEKKLEIHGRGL
jgi:hypothetical protein